MATVERNIFDEMEQAFRNKMGYERTESFHNLGQPTGLFEVIWQNPVGDIFKTRVAARTNCDAAWKVAEMAFDTFHPDGRQLIDVIRLS